MLIRLLLTSLCVLLPTNKSFSQAQSSLDQRHPFEIRVAPLAFLAKWYGVETAFHLNDHLDLGVNYTHYAAAVTYRFSDMFNILPVQRGNSYGVNINYYFLAFENDNKPWYTSLKMNYNDYKASGGSFDIYEHKGSNITFVLGKKESLPFGSEQLSLLFGLGAQFLLYKADRHAQSQTSGIITTTKVTNATRFPFFEIKLAYQF